MDGFLNILLYLAFAFAIKMEAIILRNPPKVSCLRPSCPLSTGVRARALAPHPGERLAAPAHNGSGSIIGHRAGRQMGQAGGQSRCNRRPVRRPANAVGFGFSSWPPNDCPPSLHWVKELWRQSGGREGWLGGSSVCGSGGCCRAEGEEDDCDWRASDSWNCEPQIEGKEGR